MIFKCSSWQLGSRINFERRLINGRRLVNFSLSTQRNKKGTQQDLQTKLRDKAAPAGDKDWEVKVKQFVPVQSAAEEAAALSSVKGTPSLSKQMAASTLTPDVVENIYMPKFRLMVRREPAFAGIGAIFNAINLRFAREELKKSNRFNSTENGIKFDNAVAGLVASVAQYGGATIKGLENGGVTLSAGWLRWGQRLELAAKYGGAVVGLFSCH
jgi:hypothetical protein